MTPVLDVGQLETLLAKTFNLGLDVGRGKESRDLVRLRLSKALLGVAEAQALAAEIAGHSRSATRAVKRLVDLAGRVPLAEGLQAEQDEIGRLMGSDEQAQVVRRRLAARRGGAGRTGGAGA
jgi:hypothetical protein